MRTRLTTIILVLTLALCDAGHPEISAGSIRVAVMSFTTPDAWQGTQLGREMSESLLRLRVVPPGCQQISSQEMRAACRRSNVDEDSIHIPVAAQRLASDLDAGYIVVGDVLEFDQIEKRTTAGKIATVFGFPDIRNAEARVTVKVRVIDGRTGCVLRESIAVGRCDTSRKFLSRDSIRNAILTGQFGQTVWNDSRIGIATDLALRKAASWLQGLVAGECKPKPALDIMQKKSA